MPFTISPSVLAPRPASMKNVDASAVRAIAQAAINVELFTIPLYMTTMYSLVGMHKITGAGNDFYKGRQWPGLAPTAVPSNPNEWAYNVIFSVFIEEMLHLQIASNVASAVGATPTFTSPMLQTASYGWICYGPDKTVIPHIVDLLDTSFDDVRVNLGALDKAQIRLFLAIEEPEADARKAIKPDKLHKYFPPVPFENWKEGDTEIDLPMFGTIGYMYQCYWDYLNLRYDDGTTLIDQVFNPGSIQNDIFDVADPSGGHPLPEYPGFKPELSDVTSPSAALPRIETMLSAITDQGEGSTLPKDAPLQRLVVESIYRAPKLNLEADYPGVTDTGGNAPSPDAGARADNGKPDHYDRFRDLQAALDTFQTWPQWFTSGNSWAAKQLESSDYDPTSNPYNLPTTTDVAAALNRMAGRDKRSDRAKNYKLLTQVIVGALAGMTGVLNQFWSQPGQSFPFAAMAGAGDRMGICWAVFGEPPDLSIGIGSPAPGKLQHCCQGLDFDGGGKNGCANPEMFHACKGSNNCAAQGGCGFVNTTTGGGACSSSLATRGAAPAAPTLYSAPSDNHCATTGGCAVPISASQLLVLGGTMQLYNFGADGTPTAIGTMPFETGENVHHVAYRAYREVMKHRGKTVPDSPPADDDLRLVFIPST